MKRSAIVLVCALLASGSAIFAQKSAIDEANKKLSGNDFAGARQAIQSALTNPETMNNAEAWYVAGKNEFKAYDALLGQKSIGTAVNDLDMANAIYNGYHYFQKGMKLDSVPEVDKKTGEPKLDKEGKVKVKTKYSKDMASILGGHFADVTEAASIYYNNKDFKKAYELWDAFVEIPQNPEYKAPVLADTIVGQIQFFQALAAWQDGDNHKAIASFKKALANHYDKKEVYDYLISNYVNLGEAGEAGVIETAKAALPKYGNEDSQYISVIINDCINRSQYDEANRLLDDAIAANPNNAELYNVKGAIYENQNNIDEATKWFLKAIELNPEYAKGQFDVGRMYYNKAVETGNSFPSNLSVNEIRRKTALEVTPLYEKALPHLQKAVDLDPSSDSYQRALDNVKYQLNQE